MRTAVIRRAAAVAAFALGAGLSWGAGTADVRIKDISRIAGLESIPLIGYGVVVGLRGTGDKDLALTKQTMANLYENFNLTLEINDLKSKNVAAVMITASAAPFHQAGDKADVTVASVGDATSLEGGVLLMTPLLDPNGELYSLAQGSVVVGGYTAGQGGAGGNTITKNHTTTAIVPGGAALRQAQSKTFCQSGIIRLILQHPDFTTATRMASAINKELGESAVARDASTVAVRVPDADLTNGQTATFVARLEAIRLSPDAVARIIVNERTGTIVMGGEVHISAAVVTHGSLTVSVKRTENVSQPPSGTTLVGNQTAVKTEVTPDTTTLVEEEKPHITIVSDTTTVSELADTLNRMGATPRDLISILEALHRLGALQMELVAM
jgi:flagellar P-ring protein FlgI